MKKLFMMLAACVMLSLAACGSKADYDSINKKIENHEQLSASDYSAMVDYLEESYSKMPQTQDPDDFEESTAWMEKNYPYTMDFAMTLGIANASGQLDSATKGRLDNLMQKINN